MACANRGTIQHRRLSAYGEFVHRHQGTVYNAAYWILGDHGLAVQATQDAFLRSFQVLTDFRGESAKLWLIGVVVRICQQRMLRGSHPCADPPAESDSIQRCLGTLSPEQRITLVLSDVQGLSYREIAETTSVPTGVVKSRLSQGRATLRNELLAQGMLLPEGRPAGTDSSPIHADKTAGMRHRVDDMLEDQIGHLSQTRIGQPADA